MQSINRKTVFIFGRNKVMKLYVLVFMLLVFNSVRSQEKRLHKTTIFESMQDYEKGGEIYFEKILTRKHSSYVVLVMESEGNKIKVTIMLKKS